METVQVENPETAGVLGGKYLSFKLCGEEYGLEILKVKEIMGLMDITDVPQTQSYVKGVINLRGKVIPVIDLRIKFGLAPEEYTDETCIIVMDVDGKLMGIVVDAVSEVLDIQASEIEPAANLEASVDTGFITGMGKVADQVVMLLDMEKVLFGSEIALIEHMRA